MDYDYMKSIIFLILLTSLIYAQGIRTKINDGNEKFNEENFEQALASYKDALLDDPLNETALFNQGDALYKLKKYEESVQIFQQLIASKNIDLASNAFFNTGNGYFQLNKFKEAIDAYQKALELNPNDQDAKYNLELTRAKIKEMADKQQQQQQQQDQNKEKIKPSEFAKKLKEQAEKLVLQRKYNEALQLLKDGLKKDPTIAAYNDFMQKTETVISIIGGKSPAAQPSVKI